MCYVLFLLLLDEFIEICCATHFEIVLVCENTQLHESSSLLYRLFVITGFKFYFVIHSIHWKCIKFRICCIISQCKLCIPSLRLIILNFASEISVGDYVCQFFTSQFCYKWWVISSSILVVEDHWFGLYQNYSQAVTIENFINQLKAFMRRSNCSAPIPPGLPRGQSKKWSDKKGRGNWIWSDVWGRGSRVLSPISLFLARITYFCTN